MNFLPTSMLMVILGLITLSSYMIDKSTQYTLLGLIFS